VTPAGEKLNRHLTAAIKEFGGQKHMPEIGGKSLASDFKITLAGLKKQMDELKIEAGGALTEMATEIKNGQEGVKRIREETAAVKAAFAEILGNEQAT
jgi:hypothetical protein